MSRLLRHRGAEVGGAIVVLLAVVALLAPWLAPHDPDAMRLGENLRPPSWAHPFGTDSLGRDVLSQVMFGARVSLIIGGALFATRHAACSIERP
jgi:peptide/nickel transport system permease protein